MTQPSIGRDDHVSVQCQSMRDADIPPAQRYFCTDKELAMLLVTGATGNVGREVANLLLASGEEVMAVTRNPAAAVLPDGAHVVAGAPSHPQTLTSVLRDVEAIFISPRALGDATAGDATAELLNLAAEQGAPRVVALSAVTVGDGGGDPRLSDALTAVGGAARAPRLQMDLPSRRGFAAEAP